MLEYRPDRRANPTPWGKQKSGMIAVPGGNLGIIATDTVAMLPVAGRRRPVLQILRCRPLGSRRDGGGPVC